MNPIYITLPKASSRRTVYKQYGWINIEIMCDGVGFMSMKVWVLYYLYSYTTIKSNARKCYITRKSVLDKSCQWIIKNLEYDSDLSTGPQKCSPV